MSIKKLLLLAFVLLLFTPVKAELAELGINPLQLELASRPLGMGGAFAGISDVHSVFYNPAGLAWTKGVSITYQDSQNISAIQAYPNGENAALGLAVAKRVIGDISIPTGTAYSESNVVALSYGTKLSFIPALYKRPLFKRIGVGVSIKGLLGQTLRRTGFIDRSAYGWDMDVGVLWKGGEWWSAGASLQNILPAGTFDGGRIYWDVGGEEGIPALFKVAGSAKIIGDLEAPIFMEERELLLAGEVIFSKTKSTMLRLGGEWNFQRRIFLRAGVMQQYQAQGVATDINLGMGYRAEQWGADLAYYREPIRGLRYLTASILYFPKEWIVLKKLDIEKPGLMIERPIEELSLEDNIVTYDDKIEIYGRVKPGVEVYINGLRASLDQDNRFKVVVPLHMEKNLIVVEARYEGEKKVWKYKVFRKAKVKVKEEEEVKRQLELARTAKEKAALEAKQKEIEEKKDRVESFVTMGVIEITPEAEFEMEAQITRGELATWLVRAGEMRLPEVRQDLFKDVPKDHPLAPYVKVVADMKLFRPFPDGTFRPGAFVSEEEGEEIFKRFKAVR
jgi:hypothetical protein